MKPILELNNISKKFIIGAEKQPYLSLRDSIKNIFSFNRENSSTKDFWALDDVSFNVNAGESIAIVGRNGAGKSTLLKILSKITPPTKGRIISRGRIASLLEVGTGFHPELSGRENIYMNGSILGMRKWEIDKHFDAIVEFSGVEQFLDTPLKRYSSGMQLRLAFAVAAHLEPEILIIDEVLAVGDSEFQQKCMGKMSEVSRSGRTVLFVSHNMSAVQQLCTRGILLNSGKVEMDAEISTVVNAYIYALKSKAVYRTNDKVLQSCIIKSVEDTFEGKVLTLEMEFNNFTADDLCADIKIASMGQSIAFCSMEFFTDLKITKGVNRFECKIGPLNLLLGNYQINIDINVPTVRNIENHDNVIQFSVDYIKLNTVNHGNILASKFGYMAPLQSWKKL